MSSVEFGLRIPNSGPLASPANLVRAAREAEALGFGSVWVHDHLSWSREMHRHHVSCGSADAVREEQPPDFYESIVTLAHVAAVTTKVRLGVACVVLPARNPVHVAKQWATLDALAGGRTIFGVGLGSKAATESKEYAAAGVSEARRGARFDEYIAAVRAVWQDDPTSFHGEFLDFDDATIYPKPRQQPYPPIWIGGATEYAVRRAARLGEGWIPGWQTPEEIRQARVALIEEAARHGRDGEAVEIGLEVITAVAKDRQTAYALGAETVRAGLASWEREFDSADLAIEQCFLGSVDDARRQVEAFVSAGVRHFELRMVYRTMDEFSEQMQLWADKLLPDYR